MQRAGHAAVAARPALAHEPGADRRAGRAPGADPARRRRARDPPGGALVYSVCTISPGREPRASIDALPGRAIRDFGAADAAGSVSAAAPDRDGTDGFFIARLRRAVTSRAGAAVSLRLDERATESSSDPSARAAGSRGCARPPCPAATAASTACSATSSCRCAPTAASTRRSCGCRARRSSPATTARAACCGRSDGLIREPPLAADRAPRRAVDPVGRLRPARRAGRRGAGRRRAGDPRRRDGRPLRAADHLRRRGRVGARRPRPRRRRDHRRAPDDRAPRAPRRRDRQGRRRQHHRSTSRRPRTCTTRCERSARPAARAGAAICPATPSTALAEVGRRDARPGAVHERQPGLGRPVVHPALARQARRGCGAAARPSGRRSRSTAASTTQTAAAVVEAGANLLVAGSAVFGSDDPAAAYARDRRRRRRGLSGSEPVAAAGRRSHSSTAQHRVAPK